MGILDTVNITKDAYEKFERKDWGSLRLVTARSVGVNDLVVTATELNMPGTIEGTQEVPYHEISNIREAKKSDVSGKEKLFLKHMK